MAESAVPDETIHDETAGAKLLLAGSRLRAQHELLSREGEHSMKKFLIALMAVSYVPFVTACNTVEGVGKDVEAGGEVVQDAAKKVKEEITE
ncbi:MAG: entericidin B [Hyphomonas sp.]